MQTSNSKAHLKAEQIWLKIKYTMYNHIEFS